MTVETNKGRRYLVLSIDDNPLLHNLMHMVLGRQPHVELVSCHSAESGMQLLSQRVPDLILLDINMPNMDGMEMLRQLKADPATAPVPVVALTSRSNPDDVEAGLAAGFADYLTKPSDLSTLMRTVARHLNVQADPDFPGDNELPPGRGSRP